MSRQHRSRAPPRFWMMVYANYGYYANIMLIINIIFLPPSPKLSTRPKFNEVGHTVITFVGVLHYKCFENVSEKIINEVYD